MPKVALPPPPAKETKGYCGGRYDTLLKQAAKHVVDGFNKNTPEYKLYAKNNWKELKEEFFTSCDTKGAYTYDTLNSFIKAKWPKAADHKIVMKIIGPYPTTKVPWQGAWQLERYNEHWAQDTRLDRLAQAMHESEGAAAIAESMAPLYLDELATVKSWLKQLKEYSEGQLIKRPAGSSKAEKEEALKEMKFILSLQERLLTLLDKTRTAINESIHVPSAVMYQKRFEAVMQDAINSPVNGKGPNDRVRTLVAQMSEIAIARNDLYDMKLPDKLTTLDVGEAPATKKSSVQ